MVAAEVPTGENLVSGTATGNDGTAEPGGGASDPPARDAYGTQGAHGGEHGPAGPGARSGGSGGDFGTAADPADAGQTSPWDISAAGASEPAGFRRER